jgi:hypothetical protein
MGDAVGIDQGEVTSVAARRRGDEIEEALVVPTAELAGDATTQHRLASLATRVVDADAVPAVAVAVPALGAAARAELEAAARAAFEDPLLVPRPVAAARWFTHTNEVDPDAVLIVVEAEGTRVVVTAVRSRPDGLAIDGPPAGYPVSSRAAAVEAVAVALTAHGLVPREIDVVVVVGGAVWLPGLAEGITATTGLSAVLARGPRAAAACGAALLAGGPDGGVGIALAVGFPAGAALLAAPHVGGAGAGGAGTGVAAAAGHALSGTTNPPPGPPGDGGNVAAAAGHALAGAKNPPPGPPGDGGSVAAAAGDALREAKKPPPKRPPRVVGRAKGALVAAPLVVTVLAVGAVTLRSCTRDPQTADLVTSSAPADPDERAGSSSTTTVGSGRGEAGARVPKDRASSTLPAPDQPATTASPPTTRRPGTVPRPESGVTPTGPAPEAPAAPDVPPDVPPSVTNLARTVEVIGADISGAPGTCCPCELPLTTQLSATVTDASGVAGVKVTWQSTGGHSGTIEMAPGVGDVWTATLGPIADTQMLYGQSTTVTWTVEAVDSAGHRQKVGPDPDAAVTLNGCVIVLT